jgi:carbon storage regulator CsrA
MLVLSRKKGESIRLTMPDGTEVEVIVLDCHGQVKVGLDAPRHIRIERNDRKPEPAPPAA